MVPINVFIGYDPCESIAWYVLAHSIARRTSVPVSITPLIRRQLTNASSGAFDRRRDALASTDFSDTRFLVPWLCDYKGLAYYMDCDQLMLSDIAELNDTINVDCAVSVRKHSHCPVEKTKFLGSAQTRYAKKNWSSFMVFSNSRCRALTPEYVSRASGLDLHQFKWLSDDQEIDGLPHDYNHLVGYNPPLPNAKHVHYTLGGPYFNEYRNCEYARAWFEELADMNHVQRQRQYQRAVIG